MSQSPATARSSHEDEVDAPDAASSSSGAEDFEVLEQSGTTGQNSKDDVFKSKKVVGHR